MNPSNAIPELQYFETHTHVYYDQSWNEYLQQAHAAGVKFLLAVGADLKTSEASQEMAENSPGVWFTAGVHPHEAEKIELSNITDFHRFRNHKKLAAIGEIGLDYYYDHSPRETQIKVFKAFLELALDWGLPAVIHCRDKVVDGGAYEDALTLTKWFTQAGGKYVMHCFAGSTSCAEKVLEQGGYLGVTGIVTFPQAENIRDVVRIAPVERLLLETDSPYLAPIPYRGGKNHPAYLPLIARKVAELKGLSELALAQITTENAFNLFQLTEV